MTTSPGPLTRVLSCVCVAVWLCSHGIVARTVPQWPGFRGPNGTGIADADRPPISFGPSEKLLWKRAIPAGHSSPVVWGDRIFLTAVEGSSLTVMALRRSDGARLWNRTIAAGRVEEVHPSASPAASTPVTDGRRVFAYFPTYGLIAFDADGTEIWRRPLPFMPIRFGTGTSPILAGGRVVLQRDGSSADAELLALDAATGEVAWRAARPLMGESWSTPVVWRHKAAEDIVTIGASEGRRLFARRRRALVGGRAARPVDRPRGAGRRRPVRERRSTLPACRNVRWTCRPGRYLSERHDSNRDGLAHAGGTASRRAVHAAARGLDRHRGQLA